MAPRPFERAASIAQIHLGFSAAGHAVQEQRAGARLAQAGDDVVYRCRLRRRRIVRSVTRGGLREKGIAHRWALVERDQPQVRQLFYGGARVAPAPLEPSDRLGSDCAHVGENCGRLPVERTSDLDARGRHDPLHRAGADSAAIGKEGRGAQLARGLALHGGKRKTHDFPDRRKVVARKVAQKGQ